MTTAEALAKLNQVQADAEAARTALRTQLAEHEKAIDEIRAALGETKPVTGTTAAGTPRRRRQRSDRGKPRGPRVGATTCVPEVPANGAAAEGAHVCTTDDLAGY